MNPSINIAGRIIGSTQRCFVIAEAGVNHNGDFTIAMKLIDAAVKAGADAVKFQTFSAQRLAAADAPKAEYQLKTTDTNESQYEMLSRLELSQEAHIELMKYCLSKKIIFLSTPFDEESADFLDSIGVPAFKISSGDLTNLPFVEHLARKGRPLLISTGMATEDEVADSIDAARAGGGQDIVLFQCVSNYPAEPADVNLRAMATMARKFGVPVGYSDHTMGVEVALAAVALGARVLEKHFTMDRRLPGPDHQASIEPEDLENMVLGIRRVELALGDGIKAPCAAELPVAAVARKSLHWRRSLASNEVVSASDLVALRPGTGVSAAEIRRVVGRRTTTAVVAGALLRRTDIEPEK